MSLTEDIRRYSHANAVETDDDTTVLHRMSMDLGGYAVYQILDKYLIIDRYINDTSFMETQIADLSSMTPIKIFVNKKILSTYILKDQPDKLFMIEALGDPEYDESKWTCQPAVNLVVYDMANFETPIRREDCIKPFERYNVMDHILMSRCGLLCATEHGMLVYRWRFRVDFAYAADVLLCTADSISRVEIDTVILETGSRYDTRYVTTMIIFDAGRQIAYHGRDINDANYYITIAQVKLSNNEGRWLLYAANITGRLKCDTSLQFVDSYAFSNDKNANAAVDSLVWSQDGCLVTYADGQVIGLTMEPSRLANSNLEGMPLRIIENDEESGSLKQMSVSMINKNAGDDTKSTDKEVIDCSPEKILNINQPGLKFKNTVVSENLLMVEISSSGDHGFLAFFHKRSKTHFELSAVLGVNNQSIYFILTTDGKYLLRSNGSEVDKYDLAIKDPSDDKSMLIDNMSASQIRVDFELCIEGTEVKVVNRLTGEQVFETTDIKLYVPDDMLHTLLVIKAWMSKDATILYVSYRVGLEGFFQVHVIAFTIKDGERRTIDRFSHGHPIDRMTACGDLIVFSSPHGETVSNSQRDTITRLRGVDTPDCVPLDSVIVQRIDSLRYEDYGENRLLYVFGQIGYRDKGMSRQHGLFAFNDGKYHVIEMLRASEGAFHFVRSPNSRLCVVFNSKKIKIFNMADNYSIFCEKVVTEGVFSVAISKLQYDSGVLAIFTKTELVSIFKMSSSSSVQGEISQVGIELLYTFDMKFSDSVIRASSSFIDSQGYLAITALICDGRFITRIIDYCKGVIKHEVQGGAYPVEYTLNSEAYILADCVLTDSSLQIKVESHYLRREPKHFITVISCHNTSTRLTQANRNDTLLHVGISKTINKNDSTGDPLKRLLAIMDRHTPSELADYTMLFNIVSMSHDDALFDAYVSRLKVCNLIEHFQALTWTVDAPDTWSRNKVIDCIEAHCKVLVSSTALSKIRPGGSSAAIRWPLESTIQSSSDWSSCCCRSS